MHCQARDPYNDIWILIEIIFIDWGRRKKREPMHCQARDFSAFWQKSAILKSPSAIHEISVNP